MAGSISFRVMAKLVGLRPLDYFVQACCLVVPWTAASRIVLLEADWTPAVNEQSEGGCHRIGQRDAVLAQYLVVFGSIDTAVMRRKACLICSGDPRLREISVTSGLRDGGDQRGRGGKFVCCYINLVMCELEADGIVRRTVVS